MLAEPVQNPHSPRIGNGMGAGCAKQRRHHCGLGSCHVAGEVRVAASPHSPWIGNGSDCSVTAAAIGCVATQAGVDLCPPSAPLLAKLRAAHAKFIAFGRTQGIGCVPMQNLLLLAKLKALGVCLCRIYCFWQK